MDCTQVDRLLDDLMDEVLSQDDLRALEAHCDACPACRAKLNATRDMLRLFADMAPEADVPLDIQANWRRAVKAEAAKDAAKRFRRWAAGIAAAVPDRPIFLHAGSVIFPASLFYGEPV